LPRVNKWIQEAMTSHTRGSLHRQLGIPQGQPIPTRFLNAIVHDGVGKTIHNPTNMGDRTVHVTGLLFHRSLATLNIRKNVRR